MKLCRKCGEGTEFYPKRRVCKDCMRASARKRSLKYYRDNIDKCREYDKFRYTNDSDRKASVKRRAAAYRKTEQGLAWQREHNKNPIIRAKRLADTRIRQTRKIMATPKWLTKEDKLKMRDMYIEAQKTGQHVDHIVPLKGKTVCGLHVSWNLQLLAAADNMSKGNRLEEV